MRVPNILETGILTMTTIENALAKIEIDARGRCVALVAKPGGRNLLAGAAPMVTLTRKGGMTAAASCSYAAGKLQFGFGSGQEEVVLGVKVHDRYLTFEVLAAAGGGVQSLVFLELPVRKGYVSSGMSGATAGNDWAVCLRELNLQTEVTLGGSPPAARASCQAGYGLVGAKSALVVAHPGALRAVLREMVRAEGVPQSILGGPWALDAESNRGSYLFAHPSEKDADAWIELGKRGGFTCLHHDEWPRSLGHYEPDPRLFPSGIEGVKAFVRKVHAAGMKAGMHTLTGCIGTIDAWVTPVPDRRLDADAAYTLAENMDEKADAILTAEKPQDHDIIWSYAGGGNALRIGAEIIQYAALSQAAPFGFLKCTRGAFGTRRGRHRKGEPVYHLRQRYTAFYPDERSTLVDEVAGAIARVFNECEFDQIYMDGSEGMGSRHAVQTMRNAIYARLKRPAIVEASEWGHWSWYYHSRMGAWDHPHWGLKRFVDRHVADIATYRLGALVQAQLGWWAVLGPGPANRAATEDEMEYFCCKSLAYDAPWSLLMPGLLTAPANARMLEYITMAGWYERLRLANYFPEPVLKQLRAAGREFHLEQADKGGWQLRPNDCLVHKVTGLGNGTDTWTVNNRFGRQSARLRLEALFAAEPYDSADSVLVADILKPAAFTVARDAAGVTHVVRRSTEHVRAGEASLCYTATNTRASAMGAWAQAGLRFTPYLDLRQGDSLGAWIHGDGKGAVLNLQLVTPREYSRAYAEHYVTLDFRGWRYFELPFRERDADKYHECEWPYFDLYGIFRNPLDTHHVSELNLYLNNLPANDTVTVCLSPLRALRTRRVELTKPAIEINGRALAIPATLRSGDYVELSARDGCRLYDEHGSLRERIALGGKTPLLRAGENRLRFACAAPAGINARAEVTLITAGPPLRGRTPDEQINWSLLRDEYDRPRAITRSAGRENRWPVVCRQSAKLAALGVELEVHQAVTLRDPQLNVGRQKIVFPVVLSAGDRLVYDGFAGCRVYRQDKPGPEAIQPRGTPLSLKPGRNTVRFMAAAGSDPEFRAVLTLVKHFY